MQKKTILQELDIPRDDDECWVRYPKHRWVYEMQRLLDVQNIPWDLHITNEQAYKVDSVALASKFSYKSGEIYIKKPMGTHLFSEVFIVKGEIKQIRHIDPITREIQETILGEIELRLNAFVTLHFQKFTGVITTETYSNEIYRIQLRPQSELAQENNNDIIKLLKRIYKRTDLTLSGLTDRVYQESLAS
jgi:hypothetical protein